MGLSLFSGSRIEKYDASGNKIRVKETVVYVDNAKTLPNPRPDNYTIIEWMEFRESGALFLLIMIKYNDCTNYEGVKILVFENCSYEELMKQKLIDPHFSEDKSFHSPIARFDPSERGMSRAALYIDCLIKIISNV